MMTLTRRGSHVVVETPGGEVPIVQVIGIGRNYAAHAAERGADVPERPMVFMKNIGALCLDGEAIEVPGVAREPSNQTDFEAELGVVIGRDAKGVSRGDAMGYVLGVTCVNDVSARWWQKEGSGGQFCLGKSFDTFCPVGPGVVPVPEIGDVQDLSVVCRVNGEVMQDGSTRDMIFPVGELIERLSAGTTLRAGTLILTGTPEGVGAGRTPPVFLGDGDVVEVEIGGVGVLRNPVEHV